MKDNQKYSISFRVKRRSVEKIDEICKKIGTNRSKLVDSFFDTILNQTCEDGEILLSRTICKSAYLAGKEFGEKKADEVLESTSIIGKNMGLNGKTM